MKTAYTYVRISKEDQSNWSISGQHNMNADYAAKHDIRIVHSFTDDGYSSKDFNRPAWKELESALSKNRNKIDYLIVAKHDRVIRNAAEGLAFIERLENKWNIRLISVMENFFIDPHSPFFFKMRADMLVQAEFERRMISDRSCFGQYSARSQGRFLGRAPFGYDNQSDAEGRPIIVINEAESVIVKEIFNDFLNDETFPNIRKKFKAEGFNLKGNSALDRMLTNPVYAGFIQVPSYKNNTAKLVPGIHTAIIPEEMYWRSYYKIKDKTRPQGRIIDDNIPLRGFLECTCCIQPMTGAKSRGKSGAYFYYYRCHRCKGENYSAKATHLEMTQVLNGLSLKNEFMNALRVEAQLALEEEFKDRKVRLVKTKKQYKDAQEKLSSLEEKYISNRIQQETYDKYFPVYHKEVSSLQSQMEELQADAQETSNLIDAYMPALTDLSYLYQLAQTVEDKQTFLKGIFPGCLTKEKIGFGTPFIDAMFYQNSLEISNLLRIKKPGDVSKTDKSPVSSGNGNRIEHLLRIIAKISQKTKAA